MLLDGKVAIVTGAAGGIGRAISLALAAEGASLALVDLPQAVAMEAAAEQVRGHGRPAHVIPADISRAPQTRHMAASVLQEFGRIDILVNNAGLTNRAPVLEITEEKLRQIFDVDVFGALFCSQAVAPHMIAQQRGKIINISSVSAELATRNMTPYCAAKAAVNMLTRGLAVEFAPHNICVNAIAPGVVETERVHARFANPRNKEDVLARTPRGTITQPADVGNVAVWLASDFANEISGQIIVVDGGYTLQGPEWW